MNIDTIVNICSTSITLIAVIIALCSSLRQRNLYQKENLFRQANQIAVWIKTVNIDNKKQYYEVVISNQSSQPIYETILSAGIIQGAGHTYYEGAEDNVCISIVPPGTFSAKVPYLGGGMNAQFGVAVSFRDINNQFWRRDAIGNLVKTERNPLAELNISLPAYWSEILPI